MQVPKEATSINKTTEPASYLESWQVVPLGSVVRLTRGISWGKNDEAPDGVPVIAIPNVKSDRVSFDVKYRIKKDIPETKLLRQGDVLLVGSSGGLHNLGRSAIAEEIPFPEATFASFLVKVDPLDAIEREFLRFLLASGLIDFPACSKRAADGKFNLQVQQLAQFPVPLPSLPEQRAIADVLRTVQRAREATEKVIAAKRQLKASLMKHLFTYGSVPLNQADKVSLKETEIGLMPSHWTIRLLGEICSVDWGNTSITKASYTKIGYPAFSATGPDGFLPFHEHEGDGIILSAIGARCGKCFFAPDKWTAIKNTVVIKAKSPEVELRFLFPLLNDESIWPKSGTGQPFIGIGKAARVPAPFPPVSEQREIAAHLAAVDGNLAAEEKRRAALDALFKSLLHHLMTGKLRL